MGTGVNRNFEFTVSRECHVPAEAVYALLADVRMHLEWGGARHLPGRQRLVSVAVPEGQATAGDTFESAGETTAGVWMDRSRVTEAAPPSVFEFVTDGTLESPGQPGRVNGSWLHRYEITPKGSGCVLTYRIRQLTFVNPLPAAKDRHYWAILHRLVIPMAIEEGVGNLVAMAEERSLAMARTRGEGEAEG